MTRIIIHIIYHDQDSKLIQIPIKDNNTTETNNTGHNTKMQ